MQRLGGHKGRAQTFSRARPEVGYDAPHTPMVDGSSSVKFASNTWECMRLFDVLDECAGTGTSKAGQHPRERNVPHTPAIMRGWTVLVASFALVQQR